jgi:uncharacterized protein
LYEVNSEGQAENNASFMNEYNFKLKNIYDKFFTKRGREIAAERQNAAVHFYDCLLAEIESTCSRGEELLGGVLDE